MYYASAATGNRAADSRASALQVALLAALAAAAAAADDPEEARAAFRKALQLAGPRRALAALGASGALAAAAARGAASAAAALLAAAGAAGAAVLLGARDARGRTPLHLAAGAGRAGALRALLAAATPALLEARDARGRTPLLEAAARGHAACVQALVRAGARGDARDAAGASALLAASASGDARVLRLLLGCARARALLRSPWGASALAAAAAVPALAPHAPGADACVLLLLPLLPPARAGAAGWAEALRLAAAAGRRRAIRALLLSGEARRRGLAAARGAGARRRVRRLAAVGDVSLEDLVLVLGLHEGMAAARQLLADDGAGARSSGAFAHYRRCIAGGATTLLHLAAGAGDAGALELLLSCFVRFEGGGAALGCDALDARDAAGRAPLHVAAAAGAGACARALVLAGASLAARAPGPGRGVSAAAALLEHVPRAGQMLCEALDARVCAEGDPLGRAAVVVDFSVLAPGAGAGAAPRLAVAQELCGSGGRRALPLLRHPLLQALLYLEWRRRRHAALVSLHLLLYLAYVGALAAFLLLRPRGAARDAARASLLALAAAALLAMLPFALLGAAGAQDRLFACLTKVFPSAVTLLGLASDYRPLLVFGFILSWLAVLHFTNVVSAVNYKFAMFQYIMRKLVDYLLVFAFILAGFSVAFYLLYCDDPDARFRSPWESVLSTTLMLLQGDLGGTPLFRGGPPALAPDVLVAGGLLQQLFVVIAVLALLNMWVGLAVRGGRQLERQGHIHYSRNQVRTLAVLERLLGWAQALCGRPPSSSAAPASRALSAADVPPELLSALRTAALRHRRRVRRRRRRASASPSATHSSSDAAASCSEDGEDGEDGSESSGAEAGRGRERRVRRLAAAVRRLATRLDRLAAARTRGRTRE